MKTIILIACMMAGLSIVSAQSVDDVREKVIDDMIERYSDVQMMNVKRMDWGSYWSTFDTGSRFNTKLHVSGLYDLYGDWVESKFTVDELLTEEVLTNLEREKIHKVASALYIEGKDFEPYYKVEGVNGRIVLMDDSFNVLDHGPLKNGLKLSRRLMKDMYSRMDSITVLDGWIYNDSLINFEIIFKSDTYFQQGRIAYDMNEEWVSLSHYMVEYTKLPLELIIFVDERGGLENFSWIERYMGVDGFYYSMQFKDGASLKLSEALMVID